jgi:uncharacterized membrane protein
MQKIKTLDEIRKDFSPAKNTYELHKSRLTIGDKIALFITKMVGNLTFFYICLVLVIVPFVFPPTLSFVHFLSSGVIQLLLLPLIMINQNLQDRHAKLIAEHDYETSVRAEKEIEAVLMHLEQQDKTMLEILRRIEKLEKNKK